MMHSVGSRRPGRAEDDSQKTISEAVMQQGKKWETAFVQKQLTNRSFLVPVIII